MKKLLVFLGMILFLQYGHTQSQKQTWMEDFDGTPISFTISPQNSWLPDATFYLPNASGTNSISYLGRVSNRVGAGDTSVLMTHSYNFSNYPYVFLRFSHICKVSPCDIARIEYREDMGGGVFGPWKVIPASSYRGGSANYRNSLVFNASSYHDWEVNDSTIAPNQSWWRDELFDLENEVGYGNVQFRFFIQRGNVTGTQLSYGWLLENVELIATRDRMESPTVRFTEPFIRDTAYFTGPFQINAEVKTNTTAPIETPWLKYTARQNSSIVKFDSVKMAPLQNTIWSAVIPQFGDGTEISYSVKGRDTLGNDASANSFYVIQQPTAPTGNVVLQGDGTVAATYPFYPSSGYARSMALFTVDEISPQVNTQITSISLRVASPSSANIPIRIWLKTVPTSKTEWDATDDYGWDDATDDAISVYNGNILFSPTGWVTIPLATPFRYTRQENLVILFEQNCGGTSCAGTPPQFFNKTLAANRLWLKYESASAPTDETMLYLMQERPDIRIGTMNVISTHSAATYSIDINDSVATFPITEMVPIVATIKNVGSMDLDSVDVSYTLNRIPAVTKTLYFTPAIKWGFDYQDTLGYYNPKMENYDTIAVWTSSPNGQSDAVTWDDTLKARIYGGRDIRINFVKTPKDTVYGTGPFEVTARIHSLSGFPINGPISLIVATTVSSITTYDTLMMTAQGSNLWTVEIPCKPYNSTVVYSIQMIDSLGNTVTASKRYIIRTLPTGNVIVGTGISRSNLTAPNLYYNYSWSRQLYLSDEINQTTGELIISRLSWQYSNLSACSQTSQRCYLRAVDDVTMTNNAYVDPIADGATLVWSGTYSVNVTLAIATRWVEVTFQTQFRLPPGKNLMVYWVDSAGTYPGYSYVHLHTAMPDNMTAYGYSDASLATARSNSNISKARPNARFYIALPSTSANSVAMDAILSPKKQADAGVQVPVIVRIRNKGTNALTSCNIDWKLDGVDMPQFPYSNPNGLPRDYTDTIVLGTCYQSFGANEIIAWVSQPNGVTDPVLSDDTIKLTSVGCSPSNYYTVGAGKNYVSISSALSSLRQCGVSSDITLALKGTFNESVDLTNLATLMGGYHLTITSEDNHPDSAIVLPPSGAYGILLGNTRNLTLKAITVNARANMVNYGIQINASCTNIVIRDCKILHDTVSTSSTYYPLYKANTTGLIDGFRMVGCLLEGGYYNANFYGGTSSAITNLGKNIVFDSNTFKSGYIYAILPYYCYFTSISYNTFLSRLTGATSYWRGIYHATYYCHFEDIIGNRFMLRTVTSGTQPSYCSGIYLSSANTLAISGRRPTMIVNNEMILSSTSATTSYGIYLASTGLSGNPPINMYHNSIYFTGTGPAQGIFTSVPSGQMNVIKNNMIYMTGSSSYPAYPIYLSTTFNNTLYDIDYNNLYTAAPPNYVGYTNGARATLADWQLNVTTDLRSVSNLPSFTNPAINLKMNLPVDIGFLCTPITGSSGVTYDIDKVSRGTALTTMGCYEAIIPRQLNATLVEIVGLRQGSVSGQSDTVKVTILNTGTTPLTSINLSWSINANSLSPQTYSLTSPLNFGNIATLTLGTIAYSTGNTEVKVWSNGVNGGTLDNYQGDDTITKVITVCAAGYSGILTIGEDASNDFHSMADFFAAMNLCGIDGDITLAFDTGIYNMSVDLSNLITLLGNHHLTLTSITGNADDVVIRPVAGSYGILLGNTNNVTIEAITVDAGTNMINYCVQINNACTNIVIRNCKLLHDTVTTSTSYIPLYKASGTGVLNGFRLLGCLLEGGGYNTTFYGGTSNTLATLGKNIVFDSNTFKSMHYYSMQPHFTYFTSISHNTFLGRITEGVPTYSYMLYLYDGCHAEDIIGNRIHQREVSSYMYAIYLTSANLTTLIPNRRPTVIANNEIIGTTYGSTTYGIYLNGTGKSTDPPIYILHNSIYFGGTGSGATYGIYMLSVPSNQLNVIKNNLVYLTGVAATAYPINLATAFSTTLYDIDYNNMYAPTNVGNVAGTAPTAKPDIDAWQNVVTTDQHSVSVLPDFVDPDNSLDLMTLSFDNDSLYAVMLPFAITDIDGKLRPGNVTMGAYERPIPMDYYDLMAVQIPQTLNEVIEGQDITISVDVWNIGAVAIDSATFGWSINGELQSVFSHIFTPALQSHERDNVFMGVFNVEDTTDYYEIEVWIETVNDKPDTIVWNNTASAIYTVQHLLAEFAQPLVEDTISSLSFDVYVRIYEGSAATIIPPKMYIQTILEGCGLHLYDSIPLVKEGELWVAHIPKQYYGSKIIYELFVADTIKNSAFLMDSTFIELGTGEVYRGNNLTIASIVSPTNAKEESCENIYSPLKVVLANMGETNYNFTQNGITIGYEVIAPQQTTYRGNLPINTGGLLSGRFDTIELISNIPMVAGIFDIKVWVSSSIDDFICDDTIRYRHLSEKTGLPVYEDFSDTVLGKDFLSIPLVGKEGWELYEPDALDIVQANTSTGVLRHSGIGTMAQLTTRQLDLLGTVNPTLEFWYYHNMTIPSTDRSYMEVNVVADGVTTLERKIFIKDTMHGWTQYFVDLSPYTSAQCVMIQFETTNRGVETQYLDLVYIYAEQNLALDTVLVPSLAICDFNNKDIQVVLHNTSAQRIDFFNDSTQINLEVRKGGNLLNSKTLTLNSGSLDAYERDTITFFIMNLDTGTYDFAAWIGMPIDNDQSDDTTRRILLINPDVSIKAIANTDDPDCFAMNSTSSQTVIIQNKGNFDVYNLPLVMEIHSGSGGMEQSYKDTLDVLLAGTTNPNFVFADFYKVPMEYNYSVLVKAELACDAYQSDNLDRITECVDLDDIEVVRLIKPDGQYDPVGGTVNLEVEIENKSQYIPYGNVKVNVQIIEGSNVVASFDETIASLVPARSVNYKFTTPYNVPSVKNYTIVVFIDRQDNNPANDTIKVIRQTNLGTIDYKGTDFVLGQNIPNPAKENTRIDYSIPEDGQVIFTVYTITGQTLHIEKRDAHSGKNEIEFNTINLADGLYYYSMEYKGERLVKKMTIRK